jgi:hypothetical protein
MIWLPVFMPPARAAVVPTASTEPTTAVVISFQAPTSACEHAVDSTFWGVSKPGSACRTFSVYAVARVTAPRDA